MMLFKKSTAECIGTFALVFFGCGAITMASTTTGLLGHAAVCAVFGLVIMVMIFATGHISGAHFNPAVTLAFATIRRFSWRQVPAYIFAQFLGALLGAVAVSACFGSGGALGVTVAADGVDLVTLGALECILTATLMFVITAVATDSRAVGQLAGLAIGSTVAIGALVGGPMTGASMNPARSLGPAFTLDWSEGFFPADQWAYVLFPILGAVAGALLYTFIRCDASDAPEGGDAAGCC
ncbi:MAG: aquaporin [Myxococcales bacterium]|nr:aquaporin [Myxococcales bacterium]